MYKILILEDDDDIAALEHDYLEMAGIQSDIVKSGSECLHRFKTINYDLFVLDIMVQELDGISVCKKIRETSEVPIIVVSAKTDEITKIRALSNGANDYVVKPFSPSELVARVKAQIERYKRLTKEESLPLIISHDIIIDRGRKSVSKNGKILNLTATEYTLLIVLANNPLKIISRSELFQELKGESYIGDETTVTVHLRRLREKIETNPGEPEIIETVWGMGYRFSPN